MVSSHIVDCHRTWKLLPAIPAVIWSVEARDPNSDYFRARWNRQRHEMPFLQLLPSFRSVYLERIVSAISMTARHG